MPDTTDTKVIGQQPASEVPASPSPAPSPVSTTETPAKVEPTDAELKFQEYEQRMAKYEQDIANIKSASQKRENQLALQASQREKELKDELEKTRVADMDEEELKIYRSEQALLESQELRERAATLEQEKQELQAFSQAYDWFLKADVPVSKLVTDQGYDALFKSGWDAINEERQALKKGFIAKPVTQEPPHAPAVVTTTAAVPGSGPTWDDIVGPGKKYATREDVYRAFETGSIPESAVPKRVR